MSLLRQQCPLTDGIRLLFSYITQHSWTRDKFHWSNENKMANGSSLRYTICKCNILSNMEVWKYILYKCRRTRIHIRFQKDFSYIMKGTTVRFDTIIGCQRKREWETRCRMPLNCFEKNQRIRFKLTAIVIQVLPSVAPTNTVLSYGCTD